MSTQQSSCAYSHAREKNLKPEIVEACRDSIMLLKLSLIQNQSVHASLASDVYDRKFCLLSA